tara:strand:+ start:7352 stop:11791 length:4440 start_codon:yes stop_codon:yes gene_type:complete
MAQSLQNRIFGSDVPSQLKQRIESRQRLAEMDRKPGEQVNDSQYAGVDETLTYSDINNLGVGGIANASSKTPAARMWCAVNISENIPTGEVYTDSKNLDKFYDKVTKNKRLGKDVYIKKTGDSEWKEYEWKRLAKSRKIYVVGNHVLNSEPLLPNEQITTPVNDELTAAVMQEILPFENETDRNQFMKPAAGITSVSSETEGTLGALKRTTVNFVVHNFHDFERIYLRYFLRPGATIFVDWGWNTGQFYNPKDILDHSNGPEKALFGQTGAVTISKGDLETVYGHVVNYDASVRDDGGFDCMVEIVSKNVSLFATKLPKTFQKSIQEGLDFEILGKLASGVFGDPVLYHLARQWSSVPTDESQLAIQLTNIATQLVGGESAQFPGSMSDGDTSSKIGGMVGMFARTLKDNKHVFYVNWGWFEDNLLNGELGFSDDPDALRSSKKSDVDREKDKIYAKYNSRNSFCRFSAELYQAMRKVSNTQTIGKWVLYPDSWGSGRASYNILRGQVPDRYDDNGELDEAVWGDGKFGRWNEADRQLGVIPLREIFISTDLIKDAVKAQPDPLGIIDFIIKKIKKETKGIIDMALTSNSYGQHTLAFVDKNVVGVGTKQGSLTGNAFMDNLLAFNPYAKNSICTEYSLNFKMPEGGLGNMLAIQGMKNVDDDDASNFGSTELNKMLDGFLAIESNNRKKEIIVDGSVVNLADKFIRYEPSVGTEASNRHNQKSKGDREAIFSYDENELFYSQQGGFSAFNSRKSIDQTLLTAIKNQLNVDRKGGQYGANRRYNSLSEYAGEVKKLIRQGVDKDKITAANNAKKNSSVTTPDKNAGEDFTGEKAAKDEAEKHDHKLVPNTGIYHLARAQKQLTENQTPLIEIFSTLGIEGMSGFVPGDLIRINYMPENYRRNAYFQIMKVKHEVAETWNTSFETQMRIAPKSGRGTPGSINNLRVTRDYLSSLELKNIDRWIKHFGNLKPIEVGPAPPRIMLPGAQNNMLSKPNHIGEMFECYFTDEIEGIDHMDRMLYLVGYNNKWRNNWVNPDTGEELTGHKSHFAWEEYTWTLLNEINLKMSNAPQHHRGTPAMRAGKIGTTGIGFKFGDENISKETDKITSADQIKLNTRRGIDGGDIKESTIKQSGTQWTAMGSMSKDKDLPKKGQVFYIVLHESNNMWMAVNYNPVNNWSEIDDLFALWTDTMQTYNWVTVTNDETEEDEINTEDQKIIEQNDENQGIENDGTVIETLQDSNQGTEVVEPELPDSKDDNNETVTFDPLDTAYTICANPPMGGWAMTPTEAKKRNVQLIPWECATKSQRGDAGYYKLRTYGSDGNFNWEELGLTEDQLDFMAGENGYYYCEYECDQCLECGLNKNGVNWCDRAECENISSKLLVGRCIFEPGSAVGDSAGTCHKAYPECGRYKTSVTYGSAWPEYLGGGYNEYSAPWIADSRCAPAVSRGERNLDAGCLPKMENGVQAGSTCAFGHDDDWFDDK